VALVSEPRSGRPGGGYRVYRRRRRTPYIVAGLVALLALGAAGVLIAVASASASLTADPVALAKVGMPLGGGRIESVSVVTGPHSRPVPVLLRGNAIWPQGKLRVGQAVSIQVVVRRPGWISWLTGARQRINLSLTTPKAVPEDTYLTLARGAPIRLRFDRAVATVAWGPRPVQLRSHVLTAPSAQVTLPRPASAGTMWVAARPRTWETSKPTPISWFPAGAATAAVASPAPGASIGPGTPISLTFSKTVTAALGSSRPPVNPASAGAWRQVSSHTIVFHPSGYGYGLGATVRVGLPAGVRLIGSRGGAVWHVPGGSTLRLQQLLAGLGYLPLDFHSAKTVGASAAAQEAAAIHPPPGSFSWRYGNVPSALRAMWSPGSAGEMTRGAIMAFQNDHGLVPDGDPGPLLWRSLIGAAMTGHRSSFGYTFVSVDKASQRLTLWHSGHTVLTTPVNTGIAQAPTASGTFAVFEHIRVGTMSGTNPDGSHYDDPGIQFISYFNGGDALHAFTRAQYGFPQSLGCVEMPLGPAGQVWPYTPIGTLVHVA
jgi:peptidoglycan hydrolase-like protein with peptidoglycan-binding domain